MSEETGRVLVDPLIADMADRKRDYTSRWKKAHRPQLNASRRAWMAGHPGYSKQRRQANVARLDLLKAAPCVDCGGRFPSVAMDFDHVRGEKTRTVSALIGRFDARWETIMAEIAKCDLVCANCHRVRTASRGESVPHKYRRGVV